jgi:hypothetical protein
MYWGEFIGGGHAVLQPGSWLYALVSDLGYDVAVRMARSGCLIGRRFDLTRDWVPPLSVDLGFSLGNALFLAVTPRADATYARLPRVMSKI